MTVTNKAIEQLSVDTIRTLAIDAVEKAKSGHPGMPMGAAPMGYELFAKLMKHNPNEPGWINRDRFVLSAGHGSMLLYSLLHLCGYDLPMEELKNFRQWGSKTPGHPEVGHTPGVDATTGPLGQGFGMAVGMAMAEAHLAAVYNRDQFNIIDHYTYVICGDGDLMEGISSEAASLAGHQKLGKLIVLYDSNDISLDGELNLSFSENAKERFEGYGWYYQRVEDGNDLNAIHQAVLAAQADYRPSLIEVKTVIGYGSPNKAGKGGHAGPHGSPLGADEVALTKKAYGWDDAQHFHVPDSVREHFAGVKEKGVKAHEAWKQQFAEYAKAYPELAKQFEIAVSGDLPEGWDKDVPSGVSAEKGTRTASGIVLNAIARNVPALVGGSADLESSTMTHMKDLGVMHPEDYSGRNIYFGVREFGMGAAANGMLLHGGLKVYCGTFFVFSDYLRPAIRLAAIMDVPAIYVFTHDSIGVGEDGPTHEPIEQLAALRVIPNVTVIRPADGDETAAAWKYAVANKRGPVALVFSRQAAPKLAGTENGAIERGAYILSDAANGQPEAIIIATGTEVQHAVAAQQQLAGEGIQVRVVSMPSWELFDKQPQDYKDSVLLPQVKARLAVEMGASHGWERYVGDQGEVLGIDKFGASAPGPVVIREYGFTPENVVSRVKKLLGK